MPSKHHRNRLAYSHKLASLAEHLNSGTHFNTEEIKQLLMFHQRMEESMGPLDRPRFREILLVVFDITDDVMLDLVFRTFDQNNDGFVDDIEWIKGMSTMMRGNIEQLIDFTYFVYDMNGDRSLAREELSHCLKGCVYGGFGVDDDELEDCERDIVEIAMTMLDVNRDGQITFEDFVNAVKMDPLLLQACGPCIPSDKAAATFLSLVTDKYRSSSQLYPGIPKKGYSKRQPRTTRLKYSPSVTTNIGSSFSVTARDSSKIDIRARSLSLSIVKSVKQMFVPPTGLDKK